MATNIELTAQCRITNVFRRKDGSVVPKVLSIKASKLLPYIQQILNECNSLSDPKRSEKFNYLPFFSIFDLLQTGEDFLFEKDKLPTETIYNKNGLPLLIIIPEDDKMDFGLNRFDLIPNENRMKIEDFMKNL